MGCYLFYWILVTILDKQLAIVYVNGGVSLIKTEIILQFESTEPLAQTAIYDISLINETPYT